MQSHYVRRTAPHAQWHAVPFWRRFEKGENAFKVYLAADTQLLPATVFRDNLTSVLGAVELELRCQGLDPKSAHYFVVELRANGWMLCPLRWARGVGGMTLIESWGPEGRLTDDAVAELPPQGL